MRCWATTPRSGNPKAPRRGAGQKRPRCAAASRPRSRRRLSRSSCPSRRPTRRNSWPFCRGITSFKSRCPRLEPEQLQSVVDVMHMECYEAGFEILTQGEKGDHLYALVSGSADIFVDDKLITEYYDTACFGELALVYSSPRAATVKTSARSVVYALDFASFRAVLAEQASRRRARRLACVKKVPLLAKMEPRKLVAVAQALESVSFADGAVIIAQGSIGDAFYIVEAGCVDVSRTVDGAVEQLTTLCPLDFFGELALLDNTPRLATCVARGHVKCLVLSRRDFDQMLGPLKDSVALHSRKVVLKAVPLFQELTDAEVDAVARAMRPEKFQKGAEIIKEGAVDAAHFYVIQSGACAALKGGADVGVLKAGAFFGERALVDAAARAATVVATEPTTCMVLDRKAFRRLVAPTVGSKFEEEMQRRQRLALARRGNGDAFVEAWAKPPFQDLTVTKLLGQGTFGRVKLVEHKGSSAVYSLKCMSKAQLLEQKQTFNVRSERDLLYECASTFVLKLYATYQGPDEVFLLMELIQGGELWQYVYEKKTLHPRTPLGGFEDKTARFYAACVTSALKYVHNKGVAYRDLKPENLLVTADGYLKLIDFGFAKVVPYRTKDGLDVSLTYTLCGTPEYIAPEILLSKGHDKAVDCWALGCVVYELLCCATPFVHADQQQIFRAILKSETSLQFPAGLDADAKALIKGLLQPNTARRHGNILGGLGAVAESAWFAKAKFDWDALYLKRLPAPYLPTLKSSRDVSNIDVLDDREAVVKYAGAQKLFDGF
mmetsp:Transcript_32971/g.115750  ORF Transcript_32971/g.115750 Transcript_32971/m.115750 type:complete len:777 (+) Transcript_32971:180-2510(+)